MNSIPVNIPNNSIDWEYVWIEHCNWIEIYDSYNGIQYLN